MLVHVKFLHDAVCRKISKLAKIKVACFYWDTGSCCCCCCCNSSLVWPSYWCVMSTVCAVPQTLCGETYAYC